MKIESLTTTSRVQTSVQPPKKNWVKPVALATIGALGVALTTYAASRLLQKPPIVPANTGKTADPHNPPVVSLNTSNTTCPLNPPIVSLNTSNTTCPLNPPVAPSIVNTETSFVASVPKDDCTVPAAAYSRTDPLLLINHESSDADSVTAKFQSCLRTMQTFVVNSFHILKGDLAQHRAREQGEEFLKRINKSLDEVQNSPSSCPGLKNSFAVSVLNHQQCPALQPALKALKCPLNAVNKPLLESLYGNEPLSDQEVARLYLTLRNSIPTSEQLSPNSDCVATVLDSVRMVVEARKHVVSRLDDWRAPTPPGYFAESVKAKKVADLLYKKGVTEDFDPLTVLGDFLLSANKRATCKKILDWYPVDGETVRKATFPECLFINR